MGFFDALDAVGKEREGEVPNPLRDGNRDAEGFGHGAGYAYPHAYRDHWVAQQYLPDALQAKVFYQPSGQGAEARIRDEVARRREAQLAAMLEEDSRAPVEVLTTSPTDRARDRWLQRTVSGAGVRLARVRDALYEAARVQRHHLLLDVSAGSGLLVWEGVRRTPEGQVWAATADATHAAALRQQAARLDELERPVVLEAAVDGVADAVTARDPAVRFDRVLGRGALTDAADALALLAALAGLLTPDGAILLAETDAARAQRLAALVDWSGAEALGARVRACEEALYAGSRAWDEARWATLAGAAGLALVTQFDVVVHGDQRLPPEAVGRWFGTPDAPGAYARALATGLDPAEIEEVARRYRTRFAGQVVPWRTVVSVARLERRSG